VIVPSNNGRPPMVVAMQWVSRITTISFMMLIPAGIGYWLDDVWGTSPWVLIVGVVLGMCIGMKQLLDIARVDSDGKPKE